MARIPVLTDVLSPNRRYQTVAIAAMFIAHEYQRFQIDRHIIPMSAADVFDPDAFGTPTLGEVPGRDGFAIIDGQQRLAAYNCWLKDKGLSDEEIAQTMVTCVIVQCPSPQHEARLFRKLNKNKPVVGNISFKDGCFLISSFTAI